MRNIVKLHDITKKTQIKRPIPSHGKYGQFQGGLHYRGGALILGTGSVLDFFGFNYLTGVKRAFSFLVLHLFAASRHSFTLSV